MSAWPLDYEPRGKYQTDDEFAAAVTPSPDADDIEICRRVREFLSEYVKLDPQYIHADRLFSELGMNVADSLDDVGFAMDLEDAMELSIPDRDLERIHSPEYTHGLSVGAFAANVLRVVKPRWVAAQRERQNGQHQRQA